MKNKNLVYNEPNNTHAIKDAAFNNNVPIYKIKGKIKFKSFEED